MVPAVAYNLSIQVHKKLMEDVLNNAVIKIVDLDKVYSIGRKQSVIYKDVNLEAYAGQVTLIMGASGSGKSSLLRQIALLDKVTKGGIAYYGREVARLGVKAKAKVRAKELGFIFQSFALITEFSVLENCCLPLLMNGASKTEANKQALAMIRKFIPDIDANNKPDELSGGEQQRVAIIRALIHKPSIVIADEPTGNLDDSNAVFIKEELIRIAKELGSAVIIVSHDNDFVELADVYYQLQSSDEQGVKSKLIRVK